MDAHISEPVPPPSFIIADFPKTVEGVILCALAKRPEWRQPGVTAFWTELDAAAGVAWPHWEMQTDLSSFFPEAAPIGGLAAPASRTLGTIDEAATYDPDFISRKVLRVKQSIFRPPRRPRWSATVIGAILIGIVVAILLLGLSHA